MPKKIVRGIGFQEVIDSMPVDEGTLPIKNPPRRHAPMSVQEYVSAYRIWKFVFGIVFSWAQHASAVIRAFHMTMRAWRAI